MTKTKRKLELENHNFRVNSKGWNKIMVDGEKYLENPKEDIWEIVGGDYKGEQLFTWDAAVRETTKAGKRMPTDKEFTELLKTKTDMPNLTYAGFCDANLKGTKMRFYSQDSLALIWSSSESNKADAWYCALDSSDVTVCRKAYTKAHGFSVRCLKG